MHHLLCSSYRETSPVHVGSVTYLPWLPPPPALHLQFTCILPPLHIFCFFFFFFPPYFGLPCLFQILTIAVSMFCPLHLPVYLKSQESNSRFFSCFFIMYYQSICIGSSLLASFCIGKNMQQ